MMMIWGAFPFMMGTAPYQELTRSREWVWAEQPIIGAEPDLQFTGKGAQTIELSGMLLPGLTGDRSSLEFLAIQANLGIPLTLIAGDGKIYGKFVLTNLTHTESVHFVDGVPRKMTFNITLKKYPDSGIIGALSGISSIVSVFS